MPKVGFISLGCPKNLVDSEVMMGILARSGCELTELAPSSPAFLYHDASPRVLSTPRHAAYIKIAEGCDHPCSFCIIPQLRGNFRSRRFESVVREAENLAAAGVREITLIGQDT